MNFQGHPRGLEKQQSVADRQGMAAALLLGLCLSLLNCHDARSQFRVENAPSKSSGTALTMPKPFVGLWMASADKANASCSKNNDDENQSFDGFLRVTEKTLKSHETSCSIRNVARAQSSDVTANAELELECNGEGDTWQSKELWSISVVRGQRLLSITKLLQWASKGPDGRPNKSNDKSKPTVGQLYLACDGRSLKEYKQRHVQVKVQTKLKMNADGSLSEIAHQFTFDRPFSDYAAKNYERTRSGLQPLAKINIDSLADSSFMTEVKTITGSWISLAPSNDYHLTDADGILTLHFSLLPKERSFPASIGVVDKTDFVSMVSGSDGWLYVQTAGGIACRITPDNELEHELRATVHCRK